MKVINQIQSAARSMLATSLSFALGAVLLGSAVEAGAAAQPPYIGAFSPTGNSGGFYSSTLGGGFFTEVYQIQLGTPSINCDSIYFYVYRGTNTFEATTSDGPDYPDVDWITYDSGTGGSTREIWVKVAWDTSDPYTSYYYLTYQDSAYSACHEYGNGFVGIYNP